MAVCKKVLLVWCLIIVQSCALRIERQAEEPVAAAAPETETKLEEENRAALPFGYGGDSSGSHHGEISNSMSDDESYGVPAQRKCPQYYSCMNKLDELQDTMKSLKSERAVMMGTLKTIINKAKDSQENIEKLTKKQKYLAQRYGQYEKIIKPNEVRIARNVRKIDAFEDRKDELEDMIDDWRKSCEDPLKNLNTAHFTIDNDNDFGIYVIYKYRDEQYTYFAAQETCRSLGMDLLTITSQAEYTYIMNELKGTFGTDSGMEDTGFWIGMNTLAEENNLRWLSTGTTANNAFSYQGAWQEDEPDYGDSQQYRAINWYEYDGDFAWSAEHYLDTSCFVCKASDLCYDIHEYDEWVEEENLSHAGSAE